MESVFPGHVAVGESCIDKGQGPICMDLMTMQADDDVVYGQNPDSYILPHVLTARRGAPVSMSIIHAAVATKMVGVYLLSGTHAGRIPEHALLASECLTLDLSTCSLCR